MITRIPAALNIVSVLKVGGKKSKGAGAKWTHLFLLPRNRSFSRSSSPDVSRCLTSVTWPSLAAREAEKVEEGTKWLAYQSGCMMSGILVFL